MSSIANAISELERQRDAIDQALTALRALDASRIGRVSNNSIDKAIRKTPRRLSAAGRRNIVAALKKRWAAKRAAVGNGALKASSAGKPKSKRKLNAATRKKMSEAAKKRWATTSKKKAA